MVFNTPEFFVFFAIVLGLYYVLNHRWQNVLLLIASYIFYGWWDWRFCSLLFISTVLDFVCGLRLKGPNPETLAVDQRRRAARHAGLLQVLQLLRRHLRRAARPFGIHPHSVTLNIILPVGISFYTFQTLSYTIDIYRGETAADAQLARLRRVRVLLPAAGGRPDRAGADLLPQIAAPAAASPTRVVRGRSTSSSSASSRRSPSRISSRRDRPVFSNPGRFMPGSYCWRSTCSPSRSTATSPATRTSPAASPLFLGFGLMDNFRAPYFSLRHPGLLAPLAHHAVAWLRDYLYISLGGNRGGS